MEIIQYLPMLNAALNSCAIVLMMAGYYAIRKNRPVIHRSCMIATLTVSTLFIVSYAIYHYKIGFVPFSGQGLVRPLYFTILTSHIILAALTLPLVIITVTFILKGNRKKHRQVARITLPVWLYVSITGVLIYLTAFHFYPPEVNYPIEY